MRLRAATKQKERHQKKVQFNQSAKKVVTNDSIGTFSPGLYILYFLKLPAPPRADLSGIYTYLIFIFVLGILGLAATWRQPLGDVVLVRHAIL